MCQRYETTTHFFMFVVCTILFFLVGFCDICCYQDCVLWRFTINMVAVLWTHILSLMLLSFSFCLYGCTVLRIIRYCFTGKCCSQKHEVVILRFHTDKTWKQILKKKPLTALHVYHHMIIMIVTWSWNTGVFSVQWYSVVVNCTFRASS